MDELLKTIDSALSARRVELWGVCAYEDALPLIDCRQRRQIPEGARSVILCAAPYRAREWPARNVCRYAVADDYHTLVGGILNGLIQALDRACPDARHVPFVDNSPVREVALAARCGLGARGRHNLLITREYGSWVHLGAVVTTLNLPPVRRKPHDGLCTGCGACARACPTGALSEKDGGFRRELCRSAITQKKGILTDWEAAQIRAGGLVWGCDLCQEACPANASKPLSPIAAFGENPLPWLTADALSDAMQRKAYGYRGRGVLERNLRLVGGG